MAPKKSSLPLRRKSTEQKSDSLPAKRRKTVQLLNPVINQSIIHPNSSASDLIKELKKALSAFQALQQQENDGDYNDLIPLCHQLADSSFFRHENAEVRILIACCLGEVLRVFAPDSPFQEAEKIKSMFKFLVRQLKGIHSVNSSTYKRCCELLEKLAVVKAFGVCCDLEDDDSQDIFIALFGLVFSAISEKHDQKIRIFMYELLAPLFADTPSISVDLLDEVFQHLVQPKKSANKVAYKLARDLLVRGSESLEGVIGTFLTDLLTSSKEERSLHVSSHPYELMVELSSISTAFVTSVLPIVEEKLKSEDLDERFEAVGFLGKFFSDQNASLASTFTRVWQSLIGRFNDSSADIRLLCVQFAKNFLVNHPEDRKEIEDSFYSRFHDPDERVRAGIIIAILCTAKSGGLQYVTENVKFMDCLKERSKDRSKYVRHLALEGLAEIYKMHMDVEEQLPTWIHNRILNSYHVNETEDRILIEKMWNTCIVPYNLNNEERMVQLLYVISTTDDNGYRAFLQIQRQLTMIRSNLADLLKTVNSTSAKNQEVMSFKISTISKFLPRPIASSKTITKLVKSMRKSRSLLEAVQLTTSATSDCKTVVDSVNNTLKQLGSPVKTNEYYSTIKVLLERSANVILDKDAILVLLQLLTNLVNSEDLLDIYRRKNFPAGNIIIEKGCKLIAHLAAIHTPIFEDPEALKVLTDLLICNKLAQLPSSDILSALSSVGKGQPDSVDNLTKFCLSMVDTGSPRQAKMAIRCLTANITDESMKKEAFIQAMQMITKNLEDVSAPAYMTAVVALGHVALAMPDSFRSTINYLVRVKIIKQLLLAPSRTRLDASKNGDQIWCDETALPHGTRCMVYGMKTVARWLIGLKTDLQSAKNSYRMFTAFVQTGGSFLNKNIECPFSESEKSWLRLTAGCTQLKIAQQKGIGDQYDAAQFCTLAQLINDNVDEVRARFARKLHKGLYKGVPDRCLPLDFIGFYALGGLEKNPNLRLALKRYAEADVEIRREYINFLRLNHPDTEKANEQIQHLTPDYSLAFAVAVLSNNPHFKSIKDTNVLKEVQNCLEFIFAPVSSSKESYSFSFHRRLIQGIKNRRNAANLNNDNANMRMYAVCDVALEMLLHGSDNGSQFGNQTFQEPKIPSLYFM